MRKKEVPLSSEGEKRQSDKGSSSKRPSIDFATHQFQLHEQQQSERRERDCLEAHGSEEVAPIKPTHDMVEVCNNASKATGDSWRIESMPDATVRLEVDRIFTQEEYQYLQRGQIPRDMDDRWFTYFENNWLFLHRSWTGHCIYKVHLEPCEEGCKIAEAWSNGDPSQFRALTPESRKKTLLGLLDNLASGKPV